MGKQVEIEGREYEVLSKEKFWKKIEKGEEIERCYVEEPLFWEEDSCSFTKPVRIYQSYFAAPVVFRKGVFLEDIVLQESVFQKGLFLGTKREDWKSLEVGKKSTACRLEKEIQVEKCQIKEVFDLVGVDAEGVFIKESEVQALAVGRGRTSRFCTTDSEITWLTAFQWEAEGVDFQKVRGKELCGKQIQARRGNWKEVEWEGKVLLENSHWGQWGVENSKFGEMVVESLSGKGVWRRTHFGGSVRFLQFEGDLTISNSYFEGDLTFRKSFFGKFLFQGNHLYQAFQVIECEFQKDAFFQGNLFSGENLFRKVNFCREFLCNGSLFQGATSFLFSNFLGRVTFSEVCFEDEFYLYRSRFCDQVFLLGTRFQKASFVNAAFLDQVFFCLDRHTLEVREKVLGKSQSFLAFVALFGGDASFTNTLFYKKVLFEGVPFLGKACFRNTYFGENVSFRESFFEGEVDFSGVFCGSELELSYACFQDCVSFDYANIGRRLNCVGTRFQKGLSFYRAMIDVFVVERGQIEGKLLYEGTVPGEEQRRDYFRVKEEYLLLKDSFQSRGKFQEEDWAYYRYRLNDRRALTQHALEILWGRRKEKVSLEVREEELQKRVLRKLERLEKEQQRLEEKPVENSLEEERKGLFLRMLEKKRERLLKEQERLRKIVACHRSFSSEAALDNLPMTRLGALFRLFLNFLWWLVDLGTGYGVKPFRIGFVAIFLIFLYTIAYVLPCLPELKQRGLAFLLDTLNFSALVFVTEVGEHPVLQKGIWMELMVVSEAFLGLFFMALFVGCYTRKIIR